MKNREEKKKKGMWGGGEGKGVDRGKGIEEQRGEGEGKGVDRGKSIEE